MLRTRSLSSTLPNALHISHTMASTEFYHPWSQTCPDFEPLLCLPTFTRSCYKRSYLRPEYELARVAGICLHFGLRQKDIRLLPVIYNIEPPRYRLADITQAKALGIQIRGSRKEMKRVYKAGLKRREESYQYRVQQWKMEQRQGIHAGRPRPRSALTSLVVDEGVSWRMQATVAFPYWDYRTQTLEPGTYCTYHGEEGKADDWRRMETIWDLHSPSRKAYYRAFLEADIPQYFLYCPAVRADYDFQNKEAGLGRYKRDGADFIAHPKVPMLMPTLGIFRHSMTFR